MIVMPTQGGIPLGIPAGMTSGDVIFWQGGVVTLWAPLTPENSFYIQSF